MSLCSFFVGISSSGAISRYEKTSIASSCFTFTSSLHKLALGAQCSLKNSLGSVLGNGFMNIYRERVFSTKWALTYAKKTTMEVDWTGGSGDVILKIPRVWAVIFAISGLHYAQILWAPQKGQDIWLCEILHGISIAQRPLYLGCVLNTLWPNLWSK